MATSGDIGVAMDTEHPQWTNARSAPAQNWINLPNRGATKPYHRRKWSKSHGLQRGMALPTINEGTK